jgi:hypothetical protein
MAGKVRQFECSLPPYTTDRKRWRRKILTSARKALGSVAATEWDNTGPFEVALLLYLGNWGKEYGKHDLDNRLKDVLDGLQGAFYYKADGKKRSRFRLIRNDASVCRAVVEKQERPLKYRNKAGTAPAGRVIVRPYRKQRWPFGA